MNTKTRKSIALLAASLVLGAAASPQSVSQQSSLSGIESSYADFNDASGAIALCKSELKIL